MRGVKNPSLTDLYYASRKRRLAGAVANVACKALWLVVERPKRQPPLLDVRPRTGNAFVWKDRQRRKR